MLRLVLSVSILLLSRPVVAQDATRGEEVPDTSAIQEPTSLARFRQGIDALLDAHEAAGQRWGVLVVSLDHGDTLYARSPDRPLVPASNMKLLTTSAALVHLGPNYRFTTHLFTDGEVVNGVLQGNVYLYGTGDPTLGRRFEAGPSAVLQAFADTLAALGIREISGDVVGDGSYYQGPGTGEGWAVRYRDAWYAAPAGALSVHENLVRLEVGAGKGSASRPEVRYTPGGRGIAVVNLARNRGKGLRVRRLAYDGPIVLEGGLNQDTSLFAVPVADPARFAAAVFRDVLEKGGITVSGGVRAIEDPGESPVTSRSVFAPTFEDHPLRVVAVHTSAPLVEILKVINHESHNLYAEQVLRAVGRAAEGDGSAEGGARAARSLLAEAGGDTAQVVMMDGSGLSSLNSVSAGGLVRLLSYMDASPLANAFERTLPAAGKGRRFRRMAGTPAEGNLRAKTGTIKGVSSLSGYVTTAGGERLAFSIISNDVESTGRSKDIENSIGIGLARLQRNVRRARPVPAS